MFKFNFNQEENEAEVVKKDNNIQWYNSKEISVPSQTIDLKNIPLEQIIKVEYGQGITLSCLSAQKVMQKLKENSDSKNFVDVLNADGQHSDLLPGRYEGGLKTWEGTKDLAQYFVNNEVKTRNNNLEGLRILDLGCGSGILGIICLLYGADVVFQDYNQEVLEAITIPNIFLNCDDFVRNKIKLYSGDWLSFLNLILNAPGLEMHENLKFDYILTSETIYNPDNHNKVCNIIKKLLKLNGLAFVAAKTHYFGVGGTLRDFENHLSKNGLISVVCWKTIEGVSREILKVQNKIS